MTSDQIKELRKLAEAATPGPWQVYLSGSRGGFCISTIAKQEEIAAKRDGVDGHTVSKANQLFLESANPSAVLALLDHISQLEIETKRLYMKLAGETLRADQGWERYEAANKDRNDLRAKSSQQDKGKEE